MAYTSWSVTFGEQPSAAKWNILGTNDASFNDGTGIGDNAIQAASLDTDAISLGYTARTTNITVTSGEGNKDGGIAVSVTIPAGGRRVEALVYCPSVSNGTANTSNGIKLWDGAIGGTQLQSTDFVQPTGITTMRQHLIISFVHTPSSGAKTYNLSLNASGGTGTFAAAATSPMFMLIKAI